MLDCSITGDSFERCSWFQAEGSLWCPHRIRAIFPVETIPVPLLVSEQRFAITYQNHPKSPDTLWRFLSSNYATTSLWATQTALRHLSRRGRARLRRRGEVCCVTLQYSNPSLNCLYFCFREWFLLLSHEVLNPMCKYAVHTYNYSSLVVKWILNLNIPYRLPVRVRQQKQL